MENNETQKKKHFPMWVLVLIVVIIVGCLSCVPLLINYSYKKGGGYETVWDGSDFLSFYGAVLSALGALFLGGLSIWQNNQLNKANEEAQRRLERISIRSNELNTISKIIEHEETRLNELSIACDKFTDFCNPTAISMRLGLSNGNYDRKLILDTQRECELLYKRVLVFLYDTRRDDLMFSIKCSFLATKMSQFFAKIRDKELDESLKALGDEIINACFDLSKIEHKYIQDYQRKLESLLFKELSLNEVRNIYNLYFVEENDGQDEDAE